MAKMGTGKIAAMILVPVVLGAVAFAGYHFYGTLQDQQSANAAVLHKFGFQITPNSPYSDSTGVLGTKQVPPTFAEDKLSPVERVIRGLMQDKEALIDENGRLKQQIEALKASIEDLEYYKNTNERFAPNSIEAEMEKMTTSLASNLTNMTAFRSLSPLRKRIVTEASINEYHRFLEQYNLLAEDVDQAKVMHEYLPEYAYCFAQAIDLAANDLREENEILQWTQNPERYPLPTRLGNDIKQLVPSCQAKLRTSLRSSVPNALLSNG